MKGDKEVKWVYFHGFINNTYGIIIIDNKTQLIEHSWSQITQNIRTIMRLQSKYQNNGWKFTYQRIIASE